MKTDAIVEIGIDATGQLFVRPATQKFLHIWRDAAEVHWDEKGGFLFSPKPRDWSYFDWYRHIIEVAKNGDGGGCILEVNGATVRTHIPPALQQQILNLKLPTK